MVMAMKIKATAQMPFMGQMTIPVKGELIPEKVDIKRTKKNSKLPTQGTAGAAGWDLYASLDAPTKSLTIQPHTSHLVNTGVAAAIPQGCVGLLFARSGLATKHHLRPSNAVGVIDSDYRGSIMVSLHNDSDDVQMINDGDRIAQLVILPYIPIKFNEVDELDDTDRGVNGFGSTGK